MKIKLLILAALIFLGNAAYSQDQSTRIFLNGGWASANPTNNSSSFDGFKLSGQYEHVLGYKPWALGGTFSYLKFNDVKSGKLLTVKYRTMPVNFYAKYLIGKSKLQPYVKVVGGLQFSIVKTVNQSGGVETSERDFGFSIGTGAGASYAVSEKVFINVDYEFLYLNNAFYSNAITNAVTFGVGFKIR